MTEERLQLLPEEFLRKLAEKEGISINDSIDKQDLVDLIIDAIEEDRAENISANNPAMQIKERKFDITLNEQYDFEDDQYPLPESYNETEIFLLLRDPAWAYSYWNIKDSEIESLKYGALEGMLVLRVYTSKTKDFSSKSGLEFSDIPVTDEDRSWYINLPETGRYYFVELVLEGETAGKILCRSNTVFSPEWEIGDTEQIRDLRGTGNDLMLVAGVYELSEAELTGRIPQRIISMIDSDFLE